MKCYRSLGTHPLYQKQRERSYYSYNLDYVTTTVRNYISKQSKLITVDARIDIIIKVYEFLIIYHRFVDDYWMFRDKSLNVLIESYIHVYNTNITNKIHILECFRYYFQKLYKTDLCDYVITRNKNIWKQRFHKTRDSIIQKRLLIRWFKKCYLPETGHTYIRLNRLFDSIIQEHA